MNESQGCRAAAMRRATTGVFVALAVGLWLPLGVAAQAVPSTDPGRVLRELPKSSLSCPREDTPPPPVAAVRQRPVEPADLGCMAGAAEAAGWMQRPEVLMVDTRLPSEHARFRVPGSVNLSHTDLSTKPYLKTKQLVLLGNGRSDPALYRQCAELKRQGFSKVHVLRGGLLSWLAAGLPTEGRRPALNEMSFIGADELWAMAQASGVTTLLEGSASELQQRLPWAVPIRDASVATISNALDQRERASKGLPLAAVVVVAGKSLNDGEIDAIRKRLGPVPVFFNALGTDELMKRLDQMEAVWASHARGPKRPTCGG